MTEIPDDVMKAARDAVNSAIDDRGAIGVIARAILAERERCAKLALSAPTLENKTKMFGSQINELYATQENLKRLIALYIREGATT